MLSLLNVLKAGLATVLLAILLCAPTVSSRAIANTTLEEKRSTSSRYVFTVFTDASESNLYVYSSEDATNWSLDAGPTYTPPTGLIRDPSVMKHTDGKYYICYTTNWNGDNFAIASSTDLVNWTLYTTVSTVSSVLDPVNSWAPEWFKDPKTGKINIVVSLSTALDGPFQPYAFTAADSTLKSWSAPSVLAGIPGTGLGYIDSFPIFYNNQYHLFAKSETSTKFIEHAVASALTGPYTFVQTGDFAGWGRAEGPCITTLPDGNFRLFADGFDSGKYIYSDSSDLYNWTAYQLVGDGMSGFIRHGTVLKQF